MKYVIVPQPIIPIDPDGKPFDMVDPNPEKTKPYDKVSLHYYLMRWVVTETSVETSPGGGQQQRLISKMGIGYAGNKRISRLDRSFRDVKPGDIVPVENTDWECVKKIIEEMVWIPPQFGACMVPLEDAWMTAPGARDSADKKKKKLRSV